MPSVVNASEFWIKPPDQFLGFFVTFVLVFLHCQKNQVTVCRSFVLGENFQSFSYQLDSLLIARDSKGMINLLVGLTHLNWLFHLWIFGSIKNCIALQDEIDRQN